MKTILATAFLALATSAAFAGGHSSPSTFQNTCSNIEFQYGAGGGAEIHAVCLRADGSPNATSIAMPPIANINGRLEVQGSTATFQKSCGAIELEAQIDGVLLVANCRTNAGKFSPASIGIPGINNSNGTLTN